MSGVVYLSGARVQPHEAVISVDDRGFLFGDPVYEVCAATPASFGWRSDTSGGCSTAS